MKWQPSAVFFYFCFTPSLHGCPYTWTCGVRVGLCGMVAFAQKGLEPHAGTRQERGVCVQFMMKLCGQPRNLFLAWQEWKLKEEVKRFYTEVEFMPKLVVK